ncbi:hypothetical protein [Nocardia sp. NPDC004604]|uniref:hypothetical protein n=1 Tax=Nocardia sp. NPDC004604 TaxID=3157013 RepID=UPI0033BF93DC
MTMAAAAGEFLIDVAKLLALGSDPVPLRAVLERASGGYLKAHGPSGSRASALTNSGIPFEVSVTGGRGQLTPAIRYVTETGSQHREFGIRLAAQCAAIGDLAAWLPNNDGKTTKLLRSFISTLYPDPAKVAAHHRFATWTGIVHHAAAPHYPTRLKVYGNTTLVSGTLQRLRAAFPGFAALASLPDDETSFEPVFAAIEVDANDALSHKIYLRVRRDVAVPMKLVRHFGDPAWTVLSELDRCGIDAPTLRRVDFHVCLAHDAERRGEPAFSLHLSPRQGIDIAAIVHDLSIRHHGTTAAVDALTRAAESSGGTWQYSVIGLGSSPERDIDKVNIYGTPLWSAW